MIEVRDSHSGAILFKKSPEEKKVEKLETELQELKRLVAQLLPSQGNLPQNQP